MTSPIPVTGKTAIYELEYLLEGEPAFHHRAKLERNSKKLDTLLQAAGIAPPAAADLAAVAGRVTALEGSVPVDVPFLNLAGAATGWSRFNTSFATLRVWRNGRTVHMVGLVKNPAIIGNGVVSDIGRVPVGLRPPLGQLFQAVVNGSSVFRVDVTPDGLVQAANNTGVSVAASSFIGINATWSTD